jgi:hypothetical protein
MSNPGYDAGTDNRGVAQGEGAFAVGGNLRMEEAGYVRALEKMARGGASVKAPVSVPDRYYERLVGHLAYSITQTCGGVNAAMAKDLVIDYVSKVSDKQWDEGRYQIHGSRERAALLLGLAELEEYCRAITRESFLK